MKRLIFYSVLSTCLAVMVIELAASGRHRQVSIQPEPRMPDQPVAPVDVLPAQEVRS